MKKIIVAVCAAAVLALSMALVGCGGASEKDKEAFVGTWELESTSDESLNGMIAALDSMGKKLTVELNADGTMASEALGAGKWELSSATEGKISQSDGNLKIAMKDGKLVITGADGDMTFVKAK